MREFLIVSLSLLGIILFAVWWVWRFVFKKSVKKIALTMLAIAQDRDMMVDPDAEIMPSQDFHASDTLDYKAEQIKAQSTFEPKKQLPRAILPDDDSSEWARDTSDSGWPRALDYETRHEPHPFREVHLRTVTGETHEIMDVDTYVPPEVDADSD